MKKYRITVNGLTLTLIILTFSCFLSGMLVNILTDSVLWIALIVAGGVSLFTAIGIIFFAYFKDCALYKKGFADRRAVKYPCNLSLLSKKLTKAKFYAVEGGFLKKKQFAFVKDSVHYYVKFTDTDDVKRSAEQEYVRYVKVHNSWRYSCLLLFLAKENINADDIAFLKECALSVLEKELKPAYMFTHHSAIIFLVDKANEEVYFFDMKSAMSMTGYAHGCRLINNLLCG